MANTQSNITAGVKMINIPFADPGALHSGRDKGR